MERKIIHDPIVLAQPSSTATEDDVNIGKDLKDTLMANKKTCAGMAANMIGKLKNIIVFFDEDECILMYNPEIIFQKGAYKVKEACLAYGGPYKESIRYKSIKVKYQDENFNIRLKTFKDFTAEIIQHEVDHCNGILV